MNEIDWHKIFRSIPEFEWVSLKEASPEPKKWNIRREWWNLKEEKYVEHPVFRKCRYRFSLIDSPVAYFASDWIVSTCEVIPNFRKDEHISWFRDIKPYIMGEPCSDNDKMYYPKNFRIEDSAVLLDLRREDSPIYGLIDKYDIWTSTGQFFKKVSKSRNPSVYPITMGLAQVAFEYKYDGILFSSVRLPKDVTVFGDAIVLFNESLVRPFKVKD
jgi:hypothetical protein